MAQLKAGVEEPAEDQWSPHDRSRRAGDDPGDVHVRPQLRLGLYRRLSTLETDGGNRRVRRGADRPLRSPAPEVEQLLKIMAIKVLCRRANVEKVDGGPKGIIVSFRDNSFANPNGLICYVAEQASFAKVRPDMKIVFIRDVEEPNERIKATTTILRDLVRIAEREAA